MCGIAGFSGSGGGRVIENMLDAMAHRGPDDCGIFRSQDVTMGHKRLAIIDLSAAGKQPMSDPGRALWLVFNGEIYNYQNLRHELEDRYPFQTRTDTETILAAYAVFGRENFLNRLEGMFAFALFSKEDKSILLARDPMGIKPLYWAPIPTGLVFASELRSLLKHPDISKDPNPEILAEYLLLRHVHHPRTAVRGVFKLGPGEKLFFQNGKIQQSRFWKPSFAIHYRQKDQEAACKELRCSFQAAVKSHLVADVPVGIMLSGGVDSGILAACAAQTGQSLKTFTIGFEGQSDNEFAPARILAKRLGAEHQEITLSPMHLGLLPLIAFQNDEPVAGPSSIAYHLALAEARKNCTVILFGHGADEILSGYEQLRILRHVRNLKKIPFASALIRMLASSIARLFPGDWAFERLQTFLNASNECLSYHLLMAVSSPQETSRLLLSGNQAGIPDDMDQAFSLEADPETSAIRFEQAGWLPDDILHRVDRMTMTHSIEGRVPYLDRRVVECANAICNSLKLHNGQEKYILRRTFESDLPPALIKRRKHRFNTPVDRFFGADFERMARRLFTTNHILTSHMFNPAGLIDLLNYKDQPSFRMLLRHNKLTAQYFARQIWTIVVYMFWYFSVIEGHSPEELAGKWCHA